MILTAALIVHVTLLVRMMHGDSLHIVLLAGTNDLSHRQTQPINLIDNLIESLDELKKFTNVNLNEMWHRMNPKTMKVGHSPSVKLTKPGDDLDGCVNRACNFVSKNAAWGFLAYCFISWYK